jgi:multidrug efflux pump subunit AcrA (membrane-fusion protein)
MFDEEKSVAHESRWAGSDAGNIVKYVLLAAVTIYVFAMLYLMFSMKSELTALQQKQAALETAQADLVKRMHAASSELKETISSEVGMTKQQLEERAAQLQKEQEATAAAAAKLAAQQSRQGQQIAAVNGEVSGVKTDVGAAKTDIQKTQSDLAATNSKLEKTIGDLGVQSGLVAHNASELEELKRKGERNYYNFTLQKNARTPVGTVSLQLKKVDPKKSRFTLDVMADDRTIEKKDKTVAEPLQFYTGRDHMLYELVVFSANKNSITGYLSTPKDAPSPVTP